MQVIATLGRGVWIVLEVGVIGMFRCSCNGHVNIELQWASSDTAAVGTFRCSYNGHV